MPPIPVVHYGLGPIGREVASLVGRRASLRSVAAADIDPRIVGRSLADLAPGAPAEVTVTDSAGALATPADVVILCTGSSLAEVAGQILDCVAAGRSVVSTCEELSYPHVRAPELAREIDRAARRQGVRVLGTGVNPGFAMDYLPVSVSGASRGVEHVAVHRVQDAGVRREQLQDKVGAGLAVDEFEARAHEGSVRHVGLPESGQAVAAAFGWRLTDLRDEIEPIVAERTTSTSRASIPPGRVLGVRQTVTGYEDGRERLRLRLDMAVGLPEPRDEVVITGDPDIRMLIPGGLHGDIATAAVVVNVIPQLLNAEPGLRVMSELAPPRPTGDVQLGHRAG